MLQLDRVQLELLSAAEFFSRTPQLLKGQGNPERGTKSNPPKHGDDKSSESVALREIQQFGAESPRMAIASPESPELEVGKTLIRRRFGQAWQDSKTKLAHLTVYGLISEG